MRDLFEVFTTRLDAANVPYMVTGSVAAMVYGEPRMTHDVDVVVSLAVEAIDAFVEAFPDEEFYCAPHEVIRVEVARPLRGHFNIIHHETGFKADVYLVGTDPLHRWAMKQRRAVPLDGAVVSVAPPEYVIVRKLEFFREGGSVKHLEDIRGMLRHSRDDIDFEVLRDKVAALDLQAQWAQVEPGEDA